MDVAADGVEDGKDVVAADREREIVRTAEEDAGHARISGRVVVEIEQDGDRARQRLEADLRDVRRQRNTGGQKARLEPVADTEIDSHQVRRAQRLTRPQHVEVGGY